MNYFGSTVKQQSHWLPKKQKKNKTSLISRHFFEFNMIFIRDPSITSWTVANQEWKVENISIELQKRSALKSSENDNKRILLFDLLCEHIDELLNSAISSVKFILYIYICVYRGCCFCNGYNLLINLTFIKDIVVIIIEQSISFAVKSIVVVAVDFSIWTKP